ncbi:MAG TPA: hypothetical protein DCO93_04235 [Clostridiales bacterium]|nr:hypothetical protein [Clostridiales bacterium]
MFISGVSTVSVFGAIKDVFGTLVVVVLLVAFIRNLPKKLGADFDTLLDIALEDWVETHKNMISLKDPRNKRDIYIKTDVNNFFGAGKTGMGRFALIEKQNSALKISFSLNKSLFFGHNGEKEDIATLLKPLGEKFQLFAQTKYKDIASVKYEVSKSNLILLLNDSINTDKDVKAIMIIIDDMYEAFLVMASREA